MHTYLETRSGLALEESVIQYLGTLLNEQLGPYECRYKGSLPDGPSRRRISKTLTNILREIDGPSYRVFTEFSSYEIGAEKVVLVKAYVIS